MAKRAKDEPKVKSDKPATTKTAASERNVIDELQNAGCSYNRALQQAWERASWDAHEATNKFADGQHRLTSDAGTRHSAAYQAWCEAMKDGANQADAAQHTENANSAYREALTGAQKETQEHWQELHQTHQQAATAVNEAYANAAKEALTGYLAAIKGIWSECDLDRFDAATLAKLAEATNHAASVARTILRS